MVAAETLTFLPMSQEPPPRSELSQRGAVVLAGAALAFIIGIARTDGALASIGLLLALLVPLTRWLGKKNLRHLRLHCQAASRAMAGQPFPALLEMRSEPSGGAAHAIEVCIQLPGGSRHVCAFDRIHAGSIATRQEFFALPQRGELRELPYRLDSEFPLGLWKHSRPGVIAHSLCVYPRPLVSKKLSIPGLWREAAVTAGASIASAAGDIRGLRPWRAGDSLKRIHPAASVRAYARGTGLIVAETDPPGFSPRHVTVLFHSYAGDRAIIRPELFERALSYLCGTLRTLCQQAIPTTLTADFDGWIEHSCRNRKELTAVLEHLARVRRQEGTELHELQRAQLLLDGHSSLIVISDMPPDTWRSAMISREMPTLVLPVRPSPSRRDTTRAKR